jgi:2-iminobutanoate/2-iminopropanoate deaminase
VEDANKQANSLQMQCLKNLAAVLDAAGSSIDNVVKVNIFLVNMDDFTAVNRAYVAVFNKDPKPVSLLK